MNDRSPTIPTLIDTHAHLDDRRLRDDLAGVLDRAVAAGVAQIVAIGTTAATSAAVLELARTHAGIFASVGIHPNDAAESGQEDWPAILDLVTQPGVAAIGETGLDRHWDRTPFPSAARVVRPPSCRCRLPTRPPRCYSLPRLPA